MDQLPAFGALSDEGRKPAGVECFTFGDPEEVLNRRELLDLIECVHNGRWYEPPIALDGLARAFRVSPHHSSAIILKRNLLVASFLPHPRLSAKAFGAFVQDYQVFGMAYLQRRRNMIGGTLRYDHLLAKYVRRGLEAGRWWWIPRGHRNEEELEPGSVIQAMQPDVNQEIYGVPEYISALQSALLNESATLFRRRYYLNGTHAGFILSAMGDFDEGDIDNLREALKNSKGVGNFKNLFLHAPTAGGKEGGIKLTPIGEVAAKDEFLGIKNTTRDDVLAAHRVPPQLLGIVPQNQGGFGNPADATDMFFELEIEPLQAAIAGDINEQAGEDVVRYRVRERRAAAAA
ncbi:MAG: phage portal protein [Allosphingosinicella sp.]|uniref:phage portal protein n=1 Tax=Allosphingosinicella sp. TaxID=2823234 RepID=UPI0039500DA5